MKNTRQTVFLKRMPGLNAFKKNSDSSLEFFSIQVIHLLYHTVATHWNNNDSVVGIDLLFTQFVLADVKFGPSR